MRVATCGLTTMDLIQYVDRMPGPDEKVQSQAARLEFGGPAANAAFTSAALGASCHLLTAVGTSPMGTLAAEQIRTSGIDLIDAVSDDWTLPVSAVCVSSDGRRSVVSRNAAQPPELRAAVCLGGYDAVLVDGHHLPLALAMAYEARALNVPVLLDGGSWKPGLDRLLPLVDAAVVSSDFTGDLPDIPYAVTGGDRPIRYSWEDRQASIPVESVASADTLGAGDVFHGAWLTFVARYGLVDFPAGLAYAAGVASFSVRFPGAHEWADHYPQQA